MIKRSRKKGKNISNQTRHPNSLDNVTPLLSGEANKLIKVAIFIFLAVATFTIYSNVQNHEFLIYDDYKYIKNNLKIKSGLSSENISWALTTFYGSNWFPVTWLSHMLDYQLYGLNPKGHHLTNLGFHIANVLILFIVLLRMTRKLWRCAFVAALFALHPLNVESVAWVAERKNVLSTLFWFLTMWAYFRYAQTKNLKTYCLVILFFTLGLMSKPMLVTLPFVLLLLDYWPLERFKLEQGGSHNETSAKSTYHVKSEFLKLMLEKVPLFALATGSSIITFISQQSGGKAINANNLSLPTRLANAMASYLEYLKKMIWPNDLAVFYPHPESALAAWKWVVCFVVLVTITTMSIRFIKKAPYFAVGWFWYLGTLVPVIGIVQVGGQAMADRYAYVPLIGIFIIVAWGLPDFLEKWPCKKRVLSISTAILIPTLMMITWMQVSLWKNSISVFKHALRVADKKPYNSFLISYHLGNAFLDKRKTEEAISYYKKSIKLNPNYPWTHYNLGKALSFAGMNEEAISHYKMAIKHKPDYAKAYNNIGTILSTAGKNEEAISYYRMAVKFKPDFAPAHSNLGNALSSKRKWEEAISHYRMATKLEPGFAEAHLNFGNALFEKGNVKEAIDRYKKTLRIRPDFVPAQKNLEMALRVDKIK